MPPSIIRLSEIQSTNSFMKNILLNEKMEEGTIVFSEFQTTGRGQRGNGWESEKGKNLTFSIVFYPIMIKAKEQFIISQFISLAIKDLLSQYVDNITIKWPNDIYWKDKKICGILIENSLSGEIINESVIGIGLNLNQEEFRSEAPNPISLKQITHEDYDLMEFLEKLQVLIIKYYSEIQTNDKISIIEQYKESLFRKNEFHLYHDGQKEFLARIKDIESNGILILETKGGHERFFAFKEVKYIL